MRVHVKPGSINSISLSADVDPSKQLIACLAGFAWRARSDSHSIYVFAELLAYKAYRFLAFSTNIPFKHLQHRFRCCSQPPPSAPSSEPLCSSVPVHLRSYLADPAQRLRPVTSQQMYPVRHAPQVSGCSNSLTMHRKDVAKAFTLNANSKVNYIGDGKNKLAVEFHHCDDPNFPSPEFGYGVSHKYSSASAFTHTFCRVSSTNQILSCASACPIKTPLLDLTSPSYKRAIKATQPRNSSLKT